MKKILCVFIAILLLSGCSGASQTDYDAVVKERDELKSQVEKLEKENLTSSSQSSESPSSVPTINKTIKFENGNEAIVVVSENETPKKASAICTFDGKNPELEYARILAFMLLFNELEIKDYMVSSMVTDNDAETTVIMYKGGEPQPSLLMSEKYKALSDKGLTKELQEISFQEYGGILKQLAD